MEHNGNRQVFLAAGARRDDSRIFGAEPATSSEASLTLPATSGTEKPTMIEWGTTPTFSSPFAARVQAEEWRSIPVTSAKATAIRRRPQATADADR